MAKKKQGKAGAVAKKSNIISKPKKKQISSDDDEVDSSSEVSNENMDEYSGAGQSSENDGSDESSEKQSSVTPVKPENYAIKQMQFRQRRGTKMNYLMNRKKEEEEDSFWQQHKGYFGELNASDDDEEDYVESSSGKDEFDSDFGQTESEHEEKDGEENKKIDEDDEEKQKQKKRRAELMKKVNVSREKPETKVSPLKKTKAESKPSIQAGNRYIHQMFSQEQLLGEAAHTEYYNWLSLKKLISIETEKKDFTKKEKHVEGDKIIYRDKLKEDGNREVSMELCGVQVHSISDLTNYWLSK